MSNEVETKIKSFVAAEKVVTQNWFKAHKWWLVAIAAAGLAFWVIGKGWL